MPMSAALPAPRVVPNVGIFDDDGPVEVPVEAKKKCRTYYVLEQFFADELVDSFGAYDSEQDALDMIRRLNPLPPPKRYAVRPQLYHCGVRNCHCNVSRKTG
jgi:hypothetical protein